MDFPDTPPEIRDSLTKYLLGFFGVIAAFLFLPRTIKYLIQKFLLGLMAEVVMVVLAGLLTEKAVDQLSREE